MDFSSEWDQKQEEAGGESAIVCDDSAFWGFREAS